MAELRSQPRFLDIAGLALRRLAYACPYLPFFMSQLRGVSDDQMWRSDEPRRLGQEHDADGERQGRDEGRAELQAPRDRASVDDDQVGDEADEDAEGGPELRRQPGQPSRARTCHDMTRAPRIWAGDDSAAKTGTVTPLQPMPKPRIRRTTKSVSHECVKAEPMGVATRTMAVMKMVHRRPNQLLSGSDSQTPTKAEPM